MCEYDLEIRSSDRQFIWTEPRRQFQELGGENKESSVIRMGALFYFIKNINKLEEQNLLAIFFDQDFRELTLYCETWNFVKLKRDTLEMSARVDRYDQNKRAQVAAAVAAAKVPRDTAEELLLLLLLVSVTGGAF